MTIQKKENLPDCKSLEGKKISIEGRKTKDNESQ